MTARRLSQTLVFLTALTSSHLLAIDAILTDDTYTKSTVGYGTSASIKINATSTGFLRFDLSTVPSDTLPQQIKKATLKLYTTKVSSPGTLAAKGQSTPWDESVAPLAPSGPLLDSRQVSTTDKRKFLTFDITSLVQSWIADPTRNFGVAIVANDGSVDVACESKESPATGHQPELILYVSSSVTALQARKNGIQSISGNNATNLVKFDLVDSDPFGAYDKATGIYTFQAPGKYLVNVNIHFQNQTWGTGEGRAITVGSLTLHYSTVEVGYTGNTSLTGQAIVDAQSGSTLAVNMQVSGGTKDILPTPHINRFEIIKIGD